MKFQQDDVDAFLNKVKSKWVSILTKHKLEWKNSEFSNTIMKLISSWNCSFNRDLIEPAIYSIW
jgi:acyl-homoserine lactone acylase PvdQ